MVFIMFKFSIKIDDEKKARVDAERERLTDVYKKCNADAVQARKMLATLNAHDDADAVDALKKRIERDNADAVDAREKLADINAHYNKLTSYMFMAINDDEMPSPYVVPFQRPNKYYDLTVNYAYNDDEMPTPDVYVHILKAYLYEQLLFDNGVTDETTRGASTFGTELLKIGKYTACSVLRRCFWATGDDGYNVLKYECMNDTGDGQDVSATAYTKIFDDLQKFGKCKKFADVNISTLNVSIVDIKFTETIVNQTVIAGGKPKTRHETKTLLQRAFKASRSFIHNNADKVNGRFVYVPFMIDADAVDNYADDAHGDDGDGDYINDAHDDVIIDDGNAPLRFYVRYSNGFNDGDVNLYDIAKFERFMKRLELTDAERRVVYLRASGKSINDVAKRLHYSKSTANTLLRRVRVKASDGRLFPRDADAVEILTAYMKHAETRHADDVVKNVQHVIDILVNTPELN